MALTVIELPYANAINATRLGITLPWNAVKIKSPPPLFAVRP